eukprot:gb/GEZN01011029.1/.p1 GENE.gb/GEZN01011029.1/~~gb/GEZN01011029.1/.p1  ORF type:complete len:379 (-),score=27.32 gb/GEZN01011029.1/:57-1151(-)
MSKMSAYLPISVSSSTASDDDEHSCSVCLSPLVDGARPQALPCMHVFHSDCIEGWLKRGSNQCPICRCEAAPPVERQRGEHEDNILYSNLMRSSASSRGWPALSSSSFSSTTGRVSGFSYRQVTPQSRRPQPTRPQGTNAWSRGETRRVVQGGATSLGGTSNSRHIWPAPPPSSIPTQPSPSAQPATSATPSAVSHTSSTRPLPVPLSEPSWEQKQPIPRNRNRNKKKKTQQPLTSRKNVICPVCCQHFDDLQRTSVPFSVAAISSRASPTSRAQLALTAHLKASHPFFRLPDQFDCPHSGCDRSFLVADYDNEAAARLAKDQHLQNAHSTSSPPLGGPKQPAGSVLINNARDMEYLHLEAFSG